MGGNGFMFLVSDLGLNTNSDEVLGIIGSPEDDL